MTLRIQIPKRDPNKQLYLVTLLVPAKEISLQIQHLEVLQLQDHF